MNTNADNHDFWDFWKPTGANASSGDISEETSSSSSSDTGECECDCEEGCCECECECKECDCECDEGPASGMSDEPIRYHEGKIVMPVTDISLSIGAVSYKHKRSYDNINQYRTDGPNGYGWKTRFQPQMEDRSGYYRVKFGEHDAVNFDSTPDAQGVYRARENFPDTLKIDNTAKTYIITRWDGKVWTFSNDSAGSVPRNFLKTVVDVEGSTLEYLYAAGRLWKIQTYQQSQPSKILGELEFFYGDQQRYSRITLKEWDDDSLRLKRQVNYVYHTGTDNFGSSGDLKTVVMEDYVSDQWRFEGAYYYRYYKDGEEHGKSHLLKMAFSPLEYESFAAAYGDPACMYVADHLALDFSTKYYQYNLQNRVVLERVDRNRRLIEFEYTTFAENDDPNAVHRKTVETKPHGQTHIVFTNHKGKVLLREIIPPPGSEDLPRTYYFTYNADGRRTHSYSPKSILSYSLLDGYPRRLEVVLAASEGKIEIREFGDDKTASKTDMVREMVQRGSQGTPITLSEYTYEKHQIDARIKWNIASITQYAGENRTLAITTRYTYLYHANSLQPSQITSILPAVSTANNGSDVSPTRITCYDEVGRTTWSKDELGIITYHEYDTVLDVEVKNIQDVNTTKTSEFTTPVPAGWATASGAGKHLVTEMEYDVDGQLTQTLGPANTYVDSDNNVITSRSVRWTVRDDANRRVLSVNGYVTLDANNNIVKTTLANPVLITMHDVAGRLLETISARRKSLNGRLLATDTFTQADYLAWSKNIFAGDQLSEKQEYFDIPATGDGEVNANFYVTRYEYDTYGRRNIVTSPDGTMAKTVFDWQDNPTQSWVGTSLANLVITNETVYGGEDGGCSTCTGTTAKPRLTIQYVDADTTRITEYGYDWRGRQIHTHGEEDENGASTYNFTTYDNMDRVVKSERFLAQQDTDQLLARTEQFYDARGNVWKTDQSVVNPADGTVQGKLMAQSWYDLAGRTTQSQSLGVNYYTRTTYDSLGRVTKSDTALSDGTVFEQTELTYDSLGHVILRATAQRLPDQTGTGALNISASPRGRYQFAAYWFDPMGRQIAVANYGTNGDTTLTRPAAVPQRSDVTIVITTTYDDATGRVLSTTDPAGRESRSFVDALGRTIRTVDNFVTGCPSAATPDCDVTVLFTYHPSGQVLTLTAVNAVTGNQTTTYEYELGRLTRETYPDASPSDPFDNITYAYNRLGQRILRRDQNGTTHHYTYDNLGRLLHDSITTLGSSTDATVRRISTSYTPAGQIDAITSYDNPIPGTDTILNQIRYTYDANGLLFHEYQSHTGPATAAVTPYTGYTYDTTKSGDYFTRRLRLTQQRYPSGSTQTYLYSAATYDDALNRVTQINNEVSYIYQGLATPIITQYLNNGFTLDYTTTGALDRFNRITDHAWKTSSGTAAVHIRHTYDRASNRLTRNDLLAASHDVNLSETYTYDNINQLIGLNRENSTRETFHYDPTGNWSQYDTESITQTRTHNAANEIVSINDEPIIRNDANGNMTRIPSPENWDSTYDLTYDAWNRLVRVTDGEIVVAEYFYDGLNRRVKKIVNDETRVFYYNRNWQCVEEFVNNTQSVQYLWGLRYVDDLVRISLNGQWLNALQDTNWNVVALLNGSTVVERYTYNAFGRRNVYDASFNSKQTSNYPSFTRSFTGQVLDVETGLLLYRSRFYNPPYGRFLQRDLIGYRGQDINLYRYTRNRSTIGLDIWGLQIAFTDDFPQMDLIGNLLFPVADDPFLSEEQNWGELPGGSLPGIENYEPPGYRGDSSTFPAKKIRLFYTFVNDFIVTPKTCGDGLSNFAAEWLPGVLAYPWPGITIHADSVEEAVQQILEELPPGSKIRQITFWGHGSPGVMCLGGNGQITIDNFKPGGGFAPLFSHMIQHPKIVFQGCNTFSGSKGQEFAVAAANYFDGTVGGYNAAIGYWLQYPGYHELSPGQEPHWPIDKKEATKRCCQENNGPCACGGKAGKTK